MSISRSGLRALIVEDDSQIARLIEATLSQLGISVITMATDGVQAVKRLDSAKQDFSFVVCDWMMPNMDGLEFLELFRKRHPDIPFVMLTAKTSAVDFNNAKRLGANYFLMKPLTPDNMRTRLQAAIDVTCAG